jgi:hypothetical protein
MDGAKTRQLLRWGKLAANGRLPATLPEPIKRDRAKDLRGFAGEGNVVERSERYASVAKPKTPQGFQAFSAGRLLGAGFYAHSTIFSHRTPGRRGAKNTFYLYFIYNILY